MKLYRHPVSPSSAGGRAETGENPGNLFHGLSAQVLTITRAGAGDGPLNIVERDDGMFRRRWHDDAAGTHSLPDPLSFA